MKFHDKMTGDITGHLTIHKRYGDGTEELHFDDHNVIVSGMSVGLSMFFTGSGSNSIVDYQIDRYQIGVSGPPTGGDTSTIYQLSGPIDNEAAYDGTDANIFVETADAIENGSDASDRVFVRIPFSKITRVDDVSVRYTLVLDEQAALNLDSGDTRDGPSGDTVNVSEVGLFMSNPDGRSGTPASLLVAYRSFTPIRKSDDFALVFRWAINF